MPDFLTLYCIRLKGTGSPEAAEQLFAIVAGTWIDGKVTEYQDARKWIMSLEIEWRIGEDSAEISRLLGIHACS